MLYPNGQIYKTDKTYLDSRYISIAGKWLQIFRFLYNEHEISNTL